MKIWREKMGSLSRRMQVMRLPKRLAAAHGGAEAVAILIATPTHGNLGDHAIVSAEIKFLSEMGFFPFEIERYQYENRREEITKAASCADLIVIDGGGNVGTLWPEENAKMNDVIERFASNPVAIFPQTAFFEDSSLGKECKRDTAGSYAKNSSLVFFSRDRATYDIMRGMAPTTKNLYVPDIVLYLDESCDKVDRSGALICLRADKERATGEECADVIGRALAARGLAVCRTDTVVSRPGRIDASNREAVLESKWAEFRSAEVVVTDRLHGMIFSAITGTPCVALDNVSRKVSQGYGWIEHIPNIRLAHSIAEVPALLDEVLAAGPCCYNRAPLDPYYDQMRAAILSVVK